MIDWRLKENRRESFIDYFYLTTMTTDYDPWYEEQNWLVKKYNLDVEQKLWLTWLMSFIYNLPTAWVVFNEFPTFEFDNFDKIKAFEEKYRQYIRFNPDTKYKKGQIHLAYQHYCTLLKGGTQKELLDSLTTSKNPVKNFHTTWDYVRSNYKYFGRVFSWMYIEMLGKCNDYPNILADTMFLRDDGSSSTRNGLAFILGHDDWHEHQSNPSFKGYTTDMYEYIEKEAGMILSEAQERFKGQKAVELLDYSTLETALCIYKKFYKRLRYLGCVLDCEAEKIKYSEGVFTIINWDDFWDSRKENVDSFLLCENEGRFKPLKEYCTAFADKGIMVNMDRYFDKYKYTEEKHEFKLF